MSLNLKSKTSYYQFDDAGMLIVPSDELSWRDSIGRTVLAWIAYGKPFELYRSIKKCYHPNHTKPRYRLRRHPNRCDIASRDHWSYFIICRVLRFGIIPINEIPKMRGMTSWMKALTGNKRAEFFYYFWAIPGAYIGNGFLRFCRWAGRISYEWDNNDWCTNYREGYDLPKLTWGEVIQLDKTKWQKLWAWIIFTSMPAYALHNKAWQIYVMPDGKKKKKLKRILLSRIGISNIMLRLLLEPEVIYNSDYLKSSYKLVTQEEVDNYPHMTGYRPGVYLDETCRRDIRELTDKEAEFNTYEKSLIIWLYNKHTS